MCNKLSINMHTFLDKTLMAESYFIYFVQACFTRYRDHQIVDLNKIITNG